ncbi:MAG: PEP-CTERM system histidine kinase PrsK [Bryobacterales bacterium]|nr:PEP-CTERM system histidine kinase PrsK [Bryobacterales bacterium]
MNLFHFLPYAAAIFGLLLAAASLLSPKRSVATWCFFAGMAVLGIDSVFTGLSLAATDLFEVVRWLTLGLIAKSFAPAAWLGFSLTYSRGDYRESLVRWRIPLAIAALLPIGLALGFHDALFEWAPAGEELLPRFGVIAKVLNATLLVANVWILMNLEQTFRSAVGTMRWRIKFVILGLAVIFGARLYVRSQAVLYSVYDVNWSGVESSGLVIGCVFLVVAYVRTGLAEIDVYPSRSVLGSSVTVLMTGGYLFVVGVLANVIRRFGGAESFQTQAFVVLLGMAGLAALLLSDRLRQRIHGFVDRHFARAQYDSVRIWTEFSRRLANVKSQAGLSTVSVKLISETFEVLSVTIWLLDEQTERFVAGASTAPLPGEDAAGSPPSAASSAVGAGLRVRSSPFDLEEVDEPWAEELRQLNRTTFPNGGNRWCVPLRAGEQSLGALVLADRVNGAVYTVEQLQLLQCIADQVTSVLLNLRLANEVARSRELEAFRTMSAFFVHDLKNAAASLNLMLKNLPVHFDDPEFRQDALRAIGNTARRIDEMIGRLTALRQRPQFKPVEADLSQLVNEALDRLGEMPRVELTRELAPLPGILADREQIQSVVTNLVLNARDALGQGGRIRIRTEPSGGSVVLTVVDNGCGMSAAFLKDSLFRPFQSTKKNGLGIGMFQSRMIVEAHGGSIRVESEPGKGSTFRVSLPVSQPSPQSGKEIK